MRNNLNPLVLAAASLVVLLPGCDSTTAPRSTSDGATRPSFLVAQATQPLVGVWAGVVTDATDLNNASFGRPPSDWIGRTVLGTFAIDIATPGIGDRNPAATAWEFGPVPGPGPFIEFVTVTALIDGQAFQTSPAEFSTIFFGDVLGIVDASTNSSFNPQDSHVGASAGGIGRNIVGFDAYFGPGGVFFDGANLAIDPTQLQFSHGVVDDLLGSGGNIQRQGTIHFTLTTVSVTRSGALLQKIIELAGTGALQPGQVDGLVGKLQEILVKVEAGNVQAACNQLGAFTNQVKGLLKGGNIPAGAAQYLISEAAAYGIELGC
jgi:hypothetical protein